MKIPKKLKVGGKVYKVFITPNLSLGNANYSGEINYMNTEIRIVPAAQHKMEADFLHEMTRAIYDHLGYSSPDEKQIDELANVLHMIICDNPKIFESGVK